MDLHAALTQIDEIRARVAATERFRGYGAVPVALSGVLAAVAAVVQPSLVSQPLEQMKIYLTLWLSVAGIGFVAAGVRVFATEWYGASPIRKSLTRLALAQFLPCLIAGGLVTLAIARQAPTVATVLPGMWQVIFALGIFASCRLLPRGIVWVGFFYLICGTANLATAGTTEPLTPWAMGGPFAFGQLATAALFFRDRETDDVNETTT